MLATNLKKERRRERKKERKKREEKKRKKKKRKKKRNWCTLQATTENVSPFTSYAGLNGTVDRVSLSTCLSFYLSHFLPSRFSQRAFPSPPPILFEHRLPVCGMSRDLTRGLMNNSSLLLYFILVSFGGKSRIESLCCCVVFFVFFGGVTVVVSVFLSFFLSSFFPSSTSSFSSSGLPGRMVGTTGLQK